MSAALRILVLGSAAGGGSPQWNCHCAMCAQHDGVAVPPFPARTQSSIALNSAGDDWLLINASPDLRQQLLGNSALRPARGLRDSGVHSVLLMDSQIDHCSGLLLLRESRQPIRLYCTPRVREDLETGYPVLKMLQSYCDVDIREIHPDGQAFEVEGLPDVRLRAIALTSKPPPYSPHRAAPAPGDNLGLLVTHVPSLRSLFYAPGLGEMEPVVADAMAQADCMLVDGTCWTDDEMQRRGVGQKLARAMGHLPQSGPGGMREVLAAYPNARRILIHINNTNPILDPASIEAQTLHDEGIEVAEDGLEIRLC